MTSCHVADRMRVTSDMMPSRAVLRGHFFSGHFQPLAPA
jgi:hypothetical protein